MPFISSMSTYRKVALAGGLLYLLTFIGSIPAAILVAPAIEPGYVAGPDADTQVALGAVLELVNVIACFGCAIALFSVVRRVHEGMAVGYLATRLFEARAAVLAAPPQPPRHVQQIEVRQLVEGRRQPLKRPARLHHRHIERLAVVGDDGAAVFEQVGHRRQHRALAAEAR